MEEAVLTDVAYNRPGAKVTVLSIPDGLGQVVKMFRTVADVRINIDTVLQNVSAVADNRAGITFTCPREDTPRAMALLKKLQADSGWRSVLYDDHVDKVSLVGVGMKSHLSVIVTFYEALADEGISIDPISTSETRISVLVNNQDVDRFARALHDAFDLGSDTEAVVYTGVGY